MHTVHRTPAVSVTAAATRDLDADLLVIPVFEDDDLADEPGLDAATGGEIARARARGEFTGKPFELFLAATGHDGWPGRRLALVGAGPKADCTADRIRRIATAAGLWARQRKLVSVAILLRRALGLAPEDGVQAAAEGAVLANYDGAAYKAEPS